MRVAELHGRAMPTLLAIIALALSVRLSTLDAASLWCDEIGQVTSYYFDSYKDVMYWAARFQQLPLDYWVGWSVYKFAQGDFTAHDLLQSGSASLFHLLIYVAAVRLAAGPSVGAQSSARLGAVPTCDRVLPADALAGRADDDDRHGPVGAGGSGPAISKRSAPRSIPSATWFSPPKPSATVQRVWSSASARTIGKRTST